MKIRFSKQVFGSYGEANPGDERDVSKGLAHELITSGIAEAVDGEQEADAEASRDAKGTAAGADVSTGDDGAGNEPDAGDDGEAVGSASDEDTPVARRAARRRRND